MLADEEARAVEYRASLARRRRFLEDLQRSFAGDVAARVALAARWEPVYAGFFLADEE